MYGEWYVACFLKDYKNPSLWGYYGNGHHGVCLKFKTNLNSENDLSINLYQIVGMGGTKEHSKLIYNNAKTPFYKIKYNQKYPEINFFRSLGVLPLPRLYEQWYMDENKCISSCASIFQNEEEWRKKYWDIFSECITTKLGDWIHEDEYRLLLTPMSIDFSDPTRRTVRYNFSDLEGIIFGINTSTEHKLRVVEIILEKCKKEDRKDFKFYQAYYCKETGKIEASELDYLNKVITASFESSSKAPAMMKT